MKPIYNDNLLNLKGKRHNAVFEHLLTNLKWVNHKAPRDECFMTPYKGGSKYTYGTPPYDRTYESIIMDDLVFDIMKYINKMYGTSYDICFGNLYKDVQNHLGWHADDGPNMDQDHPICTVSFGAEREIWCKHRKNIAGKIPDTDKVLLKSGSIFIMPAGFQQLYLHRIPKSGIIQKIPRISLTFRKYK